MEDILKKLEAESLSLEPDSELRALWRNKVLQYTEDFLDNVNTLNAFNAYSDEQINDFDFGISENPTNIDNLLEIIKHGVDIPGLNPASGGHLGYIPGGGIYTSALGDYLADIFNKFAGLYYAGPGAVKMENTLIRWMCEIMGFPKQSLGNLTSGGSIANLIAVTSARDAKNINCTNISKSVIYITEQAHHSLDKAFRIAGLSETIIRRVNLDSEFRMDIKHLEILVENDVQAGLNPFMAVGSAGTTNTGSIDPLDEIARICSKYNMWFHADAAYGGFFILVDELKHKFKGIEKSDSITIDPHKGLFLSYGTGAVLVKNTSNMVKTHFYQASYLQDADFDENEPSPADLSPELTKHFRGMRMWLSLKLLGLKPFVAALHEKYYLTQYFYKKIKEAGFETGPEPELSVMIYRYVPQNTDADLFNKEIVEFVKNDGRVFLSSTTINGKFWIRLAVLSFRARKSTIDTAISVLKEAVKHAHSKFGQ